MPTYEYRCPMCYGVKEKRAEMSKADKANPYCHGRRMERVYSAVAGVFLGTEISKTMYEYERDNWALATGVRHETGKDLEDWARANGKAIVPKGYKPPPPELPVSDRQLEKALEKTYKDNHDCGEIRP